MSYLVLVAWMQEMVIISTLIVPIYCDSEMTSSVMAMDANGREWKVGVAGEELGVETSEKVALTGERPAELGQDEVILRQGRDLGEEEEEEEVGVSESAARVFVSRGGMALGMSLRGRRLCVQREAAAEGKSRGWEDGKEEEEEEDRWTVG